MKELIDKLDDVLYYINTANTPPYFTDGDIAKRFPEMTSQQQIAMLGKLERDFTVYAEIRESNKIKNYYPSFEGLYLQSQGGYRARFTTEKAYADELQREKCRVVRIDESNLLNQEKLICAGWAAGAGTVFLGVMELIKYFHLFGHHSCS